MDPSENGLTGGSEWATCSAGFTPGTSHRDYLVLVGDPEQQQTLNVVVPLNQTPHIPKAHSNLLNMTVTFR